MSDSHFVNSIELKEKYTYIHTLRNIVFFTFVRIKDQICEIIKSERKGKCKKECILNSIYMNHISDLYLDCLTKRHGKSFVPHFAGDRFIW